MEKLWPTYVHQTTLLDAKEVDSKKSLTYVFCPQVNGRLFSKVEHEKQIEMEAELSKDSTLSTSATAVNDNLSKETIDHSMNTTNNSSSNSSTKRRKRARKKKKKTSSLNKDFIEISESSRVEWTTADNDWSEVKVGLRKIRNIFLKYTAAVCIKSAHLARNTMNYTLVRTIYSPV